MGEACRRRLALDPRSLPYGRWRCADGREVLFNRGYRPVWQRAAPDAPAEPADPDERVPFVEQVFFYTDWNPPRRNPRSRRRCLALLEEWGVAVVS